jgi:hypothetical protein
LKVFSAGAGSTPRSELGRRTYYQVDCHGHGAIACSECTKSAQMVLVDPKKPWNVQ